MKRERKYDKKEAKEFIARSVKSDVDMAKVADAIETLEQKPNTWSLDDVREDFMHDVYNTLDFLPTNEEANRIIDIFDRVISGIKQEPILEKIRAEILEEKECSYADFERYKVEYLGQDWEDVQDSLPQDDFRYGMERCIDIIDKYKAETEE